MQDDRNRTEYTLRRATLAVTSRWMQCHPAENQSPTISGRNSTAPSPADNLPDTSA